MTSRSVIITNRAIALQTIEKHLPPKFVESLPTNSDARMVAILEHLASAFEKRANKGEDKPKLAKQVPEPEPEPELEPEPEPEPELPQEKVSSK